MKKITGIIAAVCFFLAAWAGSAHAAGTAAVMNLYARDEALIAFVKSQEAEIEKVYIGSDEAQGFSVEEPGSVRTIVALDNSLSIREEYREAIKAFLTELVAARRDGDTFTIVTFAEDIAYLVQESNDYLDIKTKVDGLEFVEQDTYFNQVLYRVLDAVSSAEDSSYEEVRYTRVIVIADGMDEEAYGYTDGELEEKVRESNLPVYAVGCPSGKNTENLKKMFALARMSKGEGYLLDEMSGAQILQDIRNDTDVIKVNITPQPQSCDGSRKTVRISYGATYCTAEVAMPFKAAETQAPSAEPAEPETEEIPGTEQASVPETAQMPAQTADAVPEEEGAEPAAPGGNPPVLWIGIAGALVLAGIAAAVIAAVRAKRRKPQKREAAIDLSGIGHTGHTIMKLGEEDKTLLLKADGGGKRPGTEMLAGAPSVKLCLQDLDDASKSFEYPVRGKVLIGKSAAKCQIVVDYSRYVSSVHCEVSARGKQLYVRDGGGDVMASTNGTFVNEQRAAPEAPLPQGAVLRLGRVRFKVTYK